MENITVIGAGLVGSLLSVYLGQRGYRVDVFDRRPDFRTSGAGGGRSINLALSDRGMLALARVGLDAEAEKLCLPMRGRMIHDLEGRQELQPYGKPGQFIRSISREGLNLLLMEAADAMPDVRFHFSHPCLNYQLESGELHLRNEEAGRDMILTPDRIIGADGAFSSLRYALQRRPRFDFQQDYLAHGYKELSIPPAEGGGWRLDPEALHIWPRHSFMLIALPNLDGSFTCTLFAPFEGEEGFDALDSEERVLAYFDRYFADAKALMPDLAGEFARNPTSALVTVRCFPWAYRNTLLLGDAAHAIVPFYGQGMNAGFEDCRLLAECLDRHEGNWDAVFPDFARSRKPDADAIAELAKRNFLEMRDRVADPQFLLQKKVASAVAERHPDRFTPVYSLVTFSERPYSEALAEMDRQQALFNEMLTWPEFAQHWSGRYWPDVEKMLLDEAG